MKNIFVTYELSTYYVTEAESLSHISGPVFDPWQANTASIGILVTTYV